MSQSPQVPMSQNATDGTDAADAKAISRNAMHRRVAIACGATAGVTFILAGLLAGQSVMPNVLNELRDRELLPVHIAGGAGADQLRAGLGRDHVAGGPGNDRIQVSAGLGRRGERDFVQCGRGFDRVIADRSDVLHGCERRLRPPGR
ncbi:MAG TPA: hypothetical protein VMY88_06350 [Acidimicrobiales bacterium]|nr:hypothetical protein [Acidimicrobiales bacterium]